MSKIYYIISAVVLFLVLSACHSLYISQAQPASGQKPILTLPKTEVPLPNTDFVFLFPEEPLLNEQISPRKNITVNFSGRDRKDIAVSDPLLMAEESSMLIDLNLIQKDEYAFPLPGAKVISTYAGRRKNHTGIDMKTCANDTIVAAFDGIIRLAKPYYAYGNVIVIRHYNGLETVYSHNSKNLVKPGDPVKAGQAIALTGRTGRATTEHLHFEVRVNGQHFNPNLVFNMQERKLNEQCLVFTKKGNRIAVKSVDLMPHQLMGDYSYSPAAHKSKGEIEREKGSL